MSVFVCPRGECVPCIPYSGLWCLGCGVLAESENQERVKTRSALKPSWTLNSVRVDVDVVSMSMSMSCRCRCRCRVDVMSVFVCPRGECVPCIPYSGLWCLGCGVLAESENQERVKTR